MTEPPKNGSAMRNPGSTMRNQRLHARAKAARREAIAVLGEADTARFRAAIDRYVKAVEVADQARRSWEDEGRPLWTNGSQGQLVERPLVRTMDRLERAAMSFGGVLASIGRLRSGWLVLGCLAVRLARFRLRIAVPCRQPGSCFVPSRLRRARSAPPT